MAKDIFLTKSIIFMVIYILSVIYLFIFINFDKSFTKIVGTLLLINYSNRLYPLLLENYIRKETSIAAFAAPIYKICNINSEFLKKFSSIDLTVNIERQMYFLSYQKTPIR